MADELLDVIDQDNSVLIQKMKSAVHLDGDRHRISAVLLKDALGKYLIPTASDKKVEAGGLYHSAAGHVLSGETYIKAAKREVMEEVGLSAEEGDFKSLGTFWLEKEYPARKEKERFEVFLLNYTADMGQIVLNDEQINGQWLSEEELKNIYTNSPERISFPLMLTCQNIFRF